MNNSLSSNGHILFTIPVISAGSYKEDIGNLSEAERQKAFFNKHHLRVFAEHDLSKTLGMVYDVSVERNQLVNNFSSERVRFYHIDEKFWYGINGSTPFCFRKEEILV